MVKLLRCRTAPHPPHRAGRGEEVMGGEGAALTRSSSSSTSALSQAQATCSGVHSSSSGPFTLRPRSSSSSAANALSWRAHCREQRGGGGFNECAATCIYPSAWPPQQPRASRGSKIKTLYADAMKGDPSSCG